MQPKCYGLSRMKLQGVVGGLFLVMVFATGCGPGLGHHGAWAKSTADAEAGRVARGMLGK